MSTQTKAAPRLDPESGEGKTPEGLNSNPQRYEGLEHLDVGEWRIRIEAAITPHAEGEA